MNGYTSELVERQLDVPQLSDPFSLAEAAD
jgi:hypothetical protein